jgi:hypothetical protein
MELSSEDEVDPAEPTIKKEIQVVEVSSDEEYEKPGTLRSTLKTMTQAIDCVSSGKTSKTEYRLSQRFKCQQCIRITVHVMVSGDQNQTQAGHYQYVVHAARLFPWPSTHQSPILLQMQLRDGIKSSHLPVLAHYPKCPCNKLFHVRWQITAPFGTTH